MRLYMDEDSMDRELVAMLRGFGYDVLTTSEATREGEADSHQLAFATGENRIIITANQADFARLHAAALRTGGGHAGIIVRVDQHREAPFVARRIRDVLQSRGRVETANFIWFV